MRLVDDVALFFCDAVAPEYRSRGFHRALIKLDYMPPKTQEFASQAHSSSKAPHHTVTIYL